MIAFSYTIAWTFVALLMGLQSSSSGANLNGRNRSNRNQNVDYTCNVLVDKEQDLEGVNSWNVPESFQYFQDISALQKEMEDVLPEDFPHANLNESTGIWFNYFRGPSSTTWEAYYINITGEPLILQTLTTRAYLAEIGRAQMKVNYGGKAHSDSSDGSKNWMGMRRNLNNESKITLEFRLMEKGFVLLDRFELIKGPTCDRAPNEDCCQFHDVPPTTATPTTTTAEQGGARTADASFGTFLVFVTLMIFEF